MTCTQTTTKAACCTNSKRPRATPVQRSQAMGWARHHLAHTQDSRMRSASRLIKSGMKQVGRSSVEQAQTCDHLVHQQNHCSVHQLGQGLQPCLCRCRASHAALVFGTQQLQYRVEQLPVERKLPVIPRDVQWQYVVGRLQGLTCMSRVTDGYSHANTMQNDQHCLDGRVPISKTKR